MVDSHYYRIHRRPLPPNVLCAGIRKGNQTQMLVNVERVTQREAQTIDPGATQEEIRLYDGQARRAMQEWIRANEL